MINAPGPCVLFATPGMLTGGFSLEVFKQWAPCEQNLIALPGYHFSSLYKISRHETNRNAFSNVNVSFMPGFGGGFIAQFMVHVNPWSLRQTRYFIYIFLRI